MPTPQQVAANQVNAQLSTGTRPAVARPRDPADQSPSSSTRDNMRQIALVLKSIS
jgi:hypothetical protein